MAVLHSPPHLGGKKAVRFFLSLLIEMLHNNMKIILASTSPRRKEILGQLIDKFYICAPQSDEEAIPNEQPLQYVTRISMNKANSIIPHSCEKAPILIIACDTIVSIDNLIIGKPLNYTDAIKKLTMLKGRTHKAISSLTLIYHNKTVLRKTGYEVSLVTFRDFDDLEIINYLAKIRYMDKAGAYAIQEHGEIIIEKINGSITNVIGFPIRLFFRMLEELNILDKALLNKGE